MVGCIKNVWKTLTHKQKIQTLLLESLFVLQGMLEVFGFSAIAAFIMMILDLEGASQNQIILLVRNITGFTGDRSVFVFLCLILLSVFLIKYAAALFSKVFLSRFVYAQEVKIVQHLYRKYIYWPYERFFESSSYGFQKRILTDARGYCRVLETVLQWIGEMINAVIVLVILLNINWKITSVIMFGCGISVWFYLGFFAKWSRNLGEERDERYKAQLKQINQSFTGIREIVLDGKQEYHAALFGQQTKAYIHAEQVFSVLSDFPRIYFEAIGTLGALGLILLVLLFVDHPETLLSQISVFALLIVKIIPSVKKNVSAKTVMDYYNVPFSTVVGELENIGEDDWTEKPDSHTADFPLQEEIVLDHITYSYPSSGENALTDVSIKIPAGAFVGISGASGSGKSTLIDIVSGLLQPVQGKVLVDGKDISQNLSQWRTRVAYIPQDVFLFEDTLKHNIAPGIPDEQIDEDRLWRAIRSAQLEEVVSQLPKGLDEPMGERGIRLSGGQCQRIALARALYKESRLLILDEATSSLDPKTEQEILKSLECLKGTITVISVAHRESALSICDTHYIVQKGKAIHYEK